MMNGICATHCLLRYNYRMADVQVGLLYDQLLDFNNSIDNKPCIFSIYWDLFQPLIREGKVLLFSPEDETKPASWIFGLRLVDNKRNIEELNVYFNQKQIEIRLFYPINSHLHISKQFEAEAQVLTNYTARLL